MKISVIIPVYNVEKYLDACLASVAAQTFGDFEVILVNDGSTDGSVKIMSDWCGKDSRFRILNRQHTNGGAARNAGMAEARGEYLSFLDSDDIFSPYLFEILVLGLGTFRADVSCCEYREFVDGEAIPVLDVPGDEHWQDCTPSCPERANVDSVGAITWDKLYRSEYIKSAGIKYVEQASTNDITFVWTAISNARKVVSTTKRLIAYRRHRGSTQGLKSKNPECGIYAHVAYLEEARRLGIDKTRPWIISSYMQRIPATFFSYYLRTLTTRSSYLIAYKLMQNFLMKYNVLDYCCEGDSDAVDRAIAVVRGAWHEKLRCWLESILAGFLARQSTSTGVQYALILLLRRVLMLVFDGRRTLRRIPGWLLRG